MSEFPRNEEPKMKFENGEAEEELDEDGLTAEEREYAQAMLDYIAEQAELKSLPGRKKEVKETGPEAAEIQNMIEKFKETFSLDELRAVVGPMSYHEAKLHTLREPARNAITDIREAHKILKAPKPIKDDLNLQIKELWKALGVVRNGVLTHEQE